MVHKTAHYFALKEGSRENPCREMTPQISVILTYRMHILAKQPSPQHY